MEWSAIQKSPAFIINLDRRSDKYEKTLNRVNNAGWSDARRWVGVDGSNSIDLKNNWNKHGNPRLSNKYNDFLEGYQSGGKQGCCLSHMNVWKYIIENDISMATIFEDDILFHEDFNYLSVKYWNRTPTSFDALFIGAQFDNINSELITRQPMYCLHAYIITREGAQKLYNSVITHPSGVYTIDVMLYDMMGDMCRGHSFIFEWYIWNGTLYYSELRTKHSTRIIRNSGLVFQDGSLDSDIDCKSDM